MNYKNINRNLWNQKTQVHIDSEFYDNKSFLEGRNSLNSVELDLFGDVKGKSILHLQCHFGQDTLSLQRMGAQATGVDLSDEAIKKAKQFNKDLELNAEFICSDVYDLKNNHDKQYDIVFASYGTIGWLPDLDKWADVINTFLKPGGRFIFVEFHPVIWTYDYEFKEKTYSYFNREEIVETTEGTYAEKDAQIQNKSVSWNHSIGEVISSLTNQGLLIEHFNEYDFSPYNCFNNTVEFEPGKFQIKHLKDKIPMLYSLTAKKDI